MCRGVDPNIFFPQGVENKNYAPALQICEMCPVQKECLEANLDEKEGVWGNTIPSERKKLRSKTLDLVHGSYASFQKGCSCELCSEAYLSYKAEWRNRRKASQEEVA